MNVLLRPAFLVCVVLFTIHQLMQYVFKLQIPFLNNYLDNLLAMPVILTLLWAERRWLFNKGDHYHLPIFEGVIATIYIIIIGEWLFPALSHRFTSDWLDIPFYLLGTVLFYVLIERRNEQHRDKETFPNTLKQQ
jgi:hypothetical protein